MKRILIIFFLLIFSLCASAKTISVPDDIVSEITKAIKSKSNLSFFEKMVINNIIKNSSINGVKLKKITMETLINYFTDDGMFKKVSENKVVEPYTGMTLEFNTDNKCKKNNCTITLDFNGDKGPNEQWVDFENPKDKVIFVIQRGKGDIVDIILPEFLN